MPSKRVKKVVSNIEHIGNRLIGKEILGAIKNRAVRAISGGMASPASFKKGGKVMKTGRALVHKGEVVLTKKSVGHLKKLLA
jgi:hypothetical protein